ncbi:MAG: peptide chain release factor N(5)-glutamine methyltransferase [Pseudomonadota bacterium]
MVNVEEIIKSQSLVLHPHTSARLDVELLVAHCLRVDRSALFREPERDLSPNQSQEIESLVKARQAGQPISQLIGRAEFFSLEFDVNAHVLTPRPETELLVERALAMIGDETSTVVDAGTGSGAIAIALAREAPTATVLACDVSTKALAVARANQQRHNAENVNLVQCDWLSAVSDGAADIILSNPPYIESSDPHLLGDGVRFEPVLALDGGVDGLNAYRELIPQAVHKLRSGGAIFLEHGFDQSDSLQKMLTKHGFEPQETLLDLSGHERICVAKKK